MVTVSISETYDLSTVVDKMTLIGIHTPRKELIQKTYPGLCMNSKYFRILKTDVILSCVSSSIAITPDMVGDNATDGIAPEDMLNPILYKACSNDSWSTLDARLNGLNFQAHEGAQVAPPLTGNQAFAENDGVTGLTDDFGVYYSLLSHSDGFRKVPVQRGLNMHGLRPLVFDKYYSHAENMSASYNAAYGNGITENSTTGNLQLASINSYAMRGRAHRMPRINTTYLTGVAAPVGTNGNGMGLSSGTNGKPVNAQAEMPDIAPVMLGAIIMPPCRKTKLFYRMTVRTYICFEGVRPIQDISTFGDLESNYFPAVYHSDYNQQSKSMDKTTDMVDVKNGAIEKIMEGR